jgi:hypothetical protein
MSLTRRTWMIGGAAFAVTAANLPAFAADDEDSHVRMPSYRPPTRGAPGGRIGGGSRGSQDEIPTLLVLAPDHMGLASTNQPVLYWYISKTTDGATIKVTVTEMGGSQPVFSTALSGQVERGIHPLSLADASVTLKPDTEYEWKISYASPTDSAKTMLSRGLVSYSEAKAGLKKDAAKAKRDDLPFIYASAGYWYDSLQAMGSLIKENPTNRSYKLMRASLLDQVRLHDPADLDRETAE